MTTLGTRLYTWLKGEAVGQDSFGNRYFREKGAPAGRRERRWVIYVGAAEASSVPPEWHGWLHHTVNVTPVEAPPHQRLWQKPHRPNPTGTAEAYHPPGHVLAGGKLTRSTDDYEPWRPA